VTISKTQFLKTQFIKIALIEIALPNGPMTTSQVRSDSLLLATDHEVSSPRAPSDEKETSLPAVVGWFLCLTIRPR
jgi:hypothetical protein